MKTDNIYIAELAYSTRVVQEGNLWDYYHGQGIKNRVYFVPVKYVIVKKENILGSKMAKDLETNKRYYCKLPGDAGTLYLPPSKMIPFDAVYPDEKANLSKRKILKLGKKAIDAFEKAKDEQE